MKRSSRPFAANLEFPIKKRVTNKGGVIMSVLRLAECQANERRTLTHQKKGSVSLDSFLIHCQSPRTPILPSILFIFFIHRIAQTPLSALCCYHSLTSTSTLPTTTLRYSRFRNQPNKPLSRRQSFPHSVKTIFFRFPHIIFAILTFVLALLLFLSCRMIDTGLTVVRFQPL